MNGALAYLMVRSVVGRIVRMARRLKQPRYAIGFLIGAAWTVFWLSSIFLRDGDFEVQMGIPPEALEALALPMARAIQLAMSLLLAIGLTLWWLVPLGGSSLELSEAELHLLLPAPVSRRSLIQYAVLRSQPGVLFGATVVTFFTGGFWPPLHGLFRFAGVWLFFTVWDLHAKGRGLWLARLRELPPATAWARRFALLGALLVFWFVLIGAAVGIAGEVIADLPGGVEDFDDFGPAARALAEQHVDGAWNGLLGWLLTPLVLLIRPYFLEMLDAGVVGWTGAWLFPLALLALHNEWVVRSQTRFEEAELDHAKRRSRKTDPGARFWKLSERRRQWRPFELTERAPPELAVIWKNLMLVHRIPAARLGLGLLAAIAAIALLARLPATPEWALGVLQVAAGLLLLAPPFFTGRSLRNDLRTDLLQLEAIRTWPIEGWRLFLAEIGAPVWLTLCQMAAGGALAIALQLSTGGGGVAGAGLADALGVPALMIGVVLVAAWIPVGLAIALLTTSLENLAALAFPSWVHLGLDKKQAAAKFGQNLLVFFVLSLALLAGIAPGAIVVALVLAVQILWWGVPFSGWELPLLGLLGALPTFLVAAGLVRIGGSVWDRLDPSEELLEGRV